VPKKLNLPKNDRVIVFRVVPRSSGLICGKCYIGQTGRPIQCRLKEHSRAIKQYDKEKSALAEHKFEDGDHTFDLEKTVVLAKTTKYHQRLMRGAIENLQAPKMLRRR
jgi:hypothetical protein